MAPSFLHTAEQGFQTDGGLFSAAPDAAVVLMSAVYLLRPMLILWGPVFAAFVFYAVAVLVNPDNGGPRSEWIIFLLLGIVPVSFFGSPVPEPS